MKYDYKVKHNGKVYPPGTEVPSGEPEPVKTEEKAEVKPRPVKKKNTRNK